MKLFSRLLGAVATLALAGSMASVASPAQAAVGDVTLTYAPTAVLPEIACIEHAYTYAVEIPADTRQWDLTVRLVSSEGVTSTRDVFGTFDGSPVTGEGTMQICSVSGGRGTYTFISTLNYTVGTAPTVYGPETTEGTLEVVGNAESKVNLKAKRKGNRVTATANVSVTLGDSTGPVAAGGKVTFQRQVGSAWKKVSKGRTDANGVVKVKFRGKKGDRIRAKFAGAGEVTAGSGGPPVPAATSKAVRVR